MRARYVLATYCRYLIAWRRRPTVQQFTHVSL